MSKFDEQYIDLCRRILAEGEPVQNYQLTDIRSADTANIIPNHTAQAAQHAKTLRLPHQILQFDLAEEFPILVSKQVGFKSAVLEMLWIFQAMSHDVRWLQKRGVTIWDEWEISADGTYQGRDFNQLYQKLHPGEPPEDFAHTIGTAYGWVVRHYDLTKSLIATLKDAPFNRRMVISLWQNEWLATAALPSCVWNSQWNVTGGRLNTLVTSRSSDVPIGLPFNVVQYAVLNHLLAQCVGLKPGQLTFITNDAHIYENQVSGIKQQIARYDQAVENRTLPSAPQLWINPAIHDFWQFDNSRDLVDIRLENYQHLGKINLPVTA